MEAATTAEEATEEAYTPHASRKHHKEVAAVEVEVAEEACTRHATRKHHKEAAAVEVEVSEKVDMVVEVSEKEVSEKEVETEMEEAYTHIATGKRRKEVEVVEQVNDAE